MRRARNPLPFPRLLVPVPVLVRRQERGQRMSLGMSLGISLSGTHKIMRVSSAVCASLAAGNSSQRVPRTKHKFLRQRVARQSLLSLAVVVARVKVGVGVGAGVG